MKTPEEWVHYWFDESNPDDFKDLIKRIQSDAYHEGQLAGLQMGKETAMKTIKEVFSKPAERSESV